MIVASSFRSSCFERLIWWLWSSPSTTSCAVWSQVAFVITSYLWYMRLFLWLSAHSICWKLYERCLFAGSFGYFFFPFESLLYQTVWCCMKIMLTCASKCVLVMVNILLTVPQLFTVQIESRGTDGSIVVMWSVTWSMVTAVSVQRTLMGSRFAPPQSLWRSSSQCDLKLLIVGAVLRLRNDLAHLAVKLISELCFAATGFNLFPQHKSLILWPADKWRVAGKLCFLINW